MRMTSVAITLILLGAGILIYAQRVHLIPTDSKTERAYQQRESIDYPTIEPWAKQIGEGYVKSQRHKNFFEKSTAFPKTQDIVKVQIVPSDEGFVVTLIDVDGVVCSYWVQGKLPIRKPLIDGYIHQMYSSDETMFPVRGITGY